MSILDFPRRQSNCAVSLTFVLSVRSVLVPIASAQLAINCSGSHPSTVSRIEIAAHQHPRDGFADWRGIFMVAVSLGAVLEEYCEQLEVTPIRLPSGRPAPQPSRRIKPSKMRILTVLSARYTLAVGRRAVSQEPGHDMAPRWSSTPLMGHHIIRDTGSGTC